MNDILQEHRNLIVSSLFALISLALFIHVAVIQSMDITREELTKASQILSKDTQTLEDSIKKSTTQQKQIEEGIKSIPDFLKHINTLAKKNNVIIRSLTPDDKSGVVFEINLITDYFTFLKFMSDLESLDTVIMGIEIHPYDPTKVPPHHIIKFAITPRNDARPLSNKRIIELKEKVAKVSRNPLQRKVGNDRPEIELTWIHKLGGLGVNREGVPYATIDRHNYTVGQTLEGRTISKIEGDTVFLEQGQQKFILRFRRQAQ